MLFVIEGGIGQVIIDGLNTPLLAILIPPVLSWLVRGLCLAGGGVLMFGYDGDKGDGSN